MLKDTVKKSMVDAMKAKDKQKKKALGMIVSELTNAEMNKKAKLVMDARKKAAKELGIDIKDVVLSPEVIDEINVNAVITEAEETEVISKMIKDLKADIGVLETKPEKAESLAETRKELEVYMQFMPEQLTVDEIEETIEKVLTKLDIIDSASNKDIGRIKKELMPLVKYKADTDVVNKLLLEYIK